MRDINKQDYQQILETLTPEEWDELITYTITTDARAEIRIATGRHARDEMEKVSYGIHAKIEEIIGRRKPVVSRWVPKDGEEWYYITATGGVNRAPTHWSGIYQYYIDSDNYYKTYAEAEARSRRDIAIRYYERRVRECNGGSQLPDIPSDVHVWVISLYHVDHWSRHGASKYGWYAVATHKEAEMIRSEMQERGLLDAYFGEQS